VASEALNSKVNAFYLLQLVRMRRWVGSRWDGHTQVSKKVVVEVLLPFRISTVAKVKRRAMQERTSSPFMSIAANRDEKNINNVLI